MTETKLAALEARVAALEAAMRPNPRTLEKIQALEDEMAAWRAQPLP